MPRTYWRLKYDRAVTAKLYELREAGFAIHNTVKALKYEQEPWSKARVIAERMGWYEIEAHGCWIGFEKSSDPEDEEPTLKILYVIEIA